jgi:MFS family permease
MSVTRVAWAGLAAQTVSFGLNFSAGVFFTPVSESYGPSATTLAVAAAAATALTGLAQPVVGLLLDRLGARLVLVGGLTLLSGGYLALAAVQRPWQFVAAYVVLCGLGFAGSSSLAISTLIGRACGDRAGPALARAAIGINLGQLLAPWAATALFAPVGVRGAYAILGAGGLVVAATLAVALPGETATVRAHRQQRDRTAAAHFPHRPLDRQRLQGRTAVATPAERPFPSRERQRTRGRAAVLVAFGLHAASLYALVLLLPEHATELGWSSVDAGRLVAVSAVAAGLASAVTAWLLRRHRPEPLLRTLHVIRASALILAAVAGPGMLVPVAVLFGAASFPVIPLTMAVLSRGLEARTLGRSLAPAWVLHQLAAGSGLAAAAAVHHVTGGYHAFFAFGFLLSLVAALLVDPPQLRRMRTSRPAALVDAPSIHERKSP